VCPEQGGDAVWKRRGGGTVRGEQRERREGDGWVPFQGSRCGTEATWLHGTAAAGWPEAGGIESGIKKMKAANIRVLPMWTFLHVQRNGLN
jgi:hypothetical protein